MNNYSVTIDPIVCNCDSEKRENVRRVLILYEENRLAIGDCCIRMGSLKCVKEYYPDAVVNINFVSTAFMHIYSALLYNNPGIDNIFSDAWGAIDFMEYDTIFFGAYNEGAFVDFLHNKYQQVIHEGQFKTAIYSFSESILPPNADMQFFLPQHVKFLEYIQVNNLLAAPNQLYLTREEQQQANKWLEEMGVKKNEKLIVFLDSTARKDKLVRIDVYFDVLMSVLKHDNIKVLVFDERNVGKEEFYREWIGEKNIEKMIFAKKRNFRDDIAVLGSDYTQLIFGPCTGLLHCASAIYNHFVSNGMDIKEVPDLIVYTGHYDAIENNANHWWGKSPLVNCLLLTELNGQKEIRLLSSLTESEKLTYTQIPSKWYTADMLSNFVHNKLTAKKNMLDLAI